MNTQAAVSSENTSVWTPRGGNPTFILEGDTFTVEVKSSETVPTTGWTAELANDLKSWEAEVVSVAAGKINHGKIDGYIFTIKASDDLPPELFNLVLKNGNVTITSERSVKIVESFEESFYILHISDEHCIAGTAKADGSVTNSESSFDMKEWVAPTINLINPRFVLYSGDTMVINRTPESWIGEEAARSAMIDYMDTMKNYTAPSVIISGNHDVGWDAYVDISTQRRLWEELVGQRAFSFRMGAFYVSAVEWTGHDYYQFSLSDYTQAYNDNTITYRLVTSHGHDGLDGWTTVANAQRPCDLQLVGHGHQTRTVSTSPYLVFMMGTAQKYNTTGIYNFEWDGESWDLEQTATRQDGVDYFKLFTGNYGANPTVNAEFSKANDGTNTSNTVTITNTLNRRFYDGRLRFEMPRGEYEVTGGTVLATYDYGTNKTAVVVSVDIKAATTTTVSIVGEGITSEAPSQAQSEAPSQAQSETPSQAQSETPSQVASDVESNDTTPKTGDNGSVLYWLIALTAIAASIVLIPNKANR